MKTRKLIILASFLSLLGMNACTNELEDMDILGLDEQPPISEEKTLTTFADIEIDGIGTQESDAVLKLSNKRELNVSKKTLSLEDFFGTNETCFPAYRDSIMQFELYTYEDLKDDTAMYHFKMDYIQKYVDSLLHDEKDYKVYELKWKYRGTEVTTIALYDNNYDLVYDNIFSNMAIINIQSSKERKKMLSRTENPIFGSCYYSNSETVRYLIQYSYSSTLLGEATFYWFEYGHWDTAPIFNGPDLVAEVHYYVHDVTQYFTDYTINASNTSLISKFRDYSEVDKARFAYCIWIGPTDSKPYVDDYLDNYIPGQVLDLTRDSYSAYSHTSYGGYIRMIEIAPQSYVEPIDSI